MSNNKVNLSLQLIPLNTIQAYAAVDKAIEVIKNSGVKYEVQPFATIMEGPLEILWAIVDEVKSAVFQGDTEEIILNIQIHMKKGKDVSFEEKTDKFKPESR